MTALTIAQKACSLLGLTAPTVVFASTDQQTIQIRNLMNEELLSLATDYPWKRLTTEKTFTTVAAAVQTNAVPDDLAWFINDTMWNRTTMVKVFGPVSPDEWQQFQALSLLSIPSSVFRFRGSDILLYPTPPAGQTVAYEYISTYCVSATGSTTGTKTAFEADTDSALVDEHIIALGVRWRFMKAKGFDYAEDFKTYEDEKKQHIARDGGRRRGYIGGVQFLNPWNANIKEGSWP